MMKRKSGSRALPPAAEEHDLAFGHAALGDMASAVRGIVLRDMAILGLRAHVQWQTPRKLPHECLTEPRPLDAAALPMAQSLSGLALALKRLCDKDVVAAPAETLVPAMASHLEALFDRAVSDERRSSVRRGLRPVAEGETVLAETKRWEADVKAFCRETDSRIDQLSAELDREQKGIKSEVPIDEDWQENAGNDRNSGPFARARTL
jgi:hypothetical protein